MSLDGTGMARITMRQPKLPVRHVQPAQASNLLLPTVEEEGNFVTPREIEMYGESYKPVSLAELEEPGYDEDPDEKILLGIVLLAKSSHVKDKTVYTYGSKKPQFKSFKTTPEHPYNRLFTVGDVKSSDGKTFVITTTTYHESSNLLSQVKHENIMGQLVAVIEPESRGRYLTENC